jgi:hypothetical protein
MKSFRVIYTYTLEDSMLVHCDDAKEAEQMVYNNLVAFNATDIKVTEVNEIE